MRIGLCSDVHGNLTALRAVVEAFNSQGSLDEIVVAGDLVQGGPRPREVWELLKALNWRLVRGNEDEVIAGQRQIGANYHPPQRDGALAQHAWTRETLGPKILRELARLPFEYRVTTPAGDLLVVHSSPRDVDDRSGSPSNTTAEVTAAYDGTGATAIAFGHFHRSFVRPMPFGLLINVASVGLPIDGRPLAAYTILTATGDGWIVEQRFVAYDPSDEAEAAAAVGMPPWPSASSPR